MTTYASNSKHEAIMVMLRVITALIFREIKTRFGGLKLGYIWAFLEPIMFISILSLIMVATGGGREVDGMPRTLFLITGFLPFFLFRSTMDHAMKAVDANRALLTFPQVKILDLVLSRVLLEFTTYFIIFLIMVSAVAMAEYEPVNVEHPLQVLLSLLLLSITGFGAGCMFGSVAAIFPTVSKLIENSISRPLFWISGVFFTMESLPSQIQLILQWNPVMQLIMMLRSAFFTGYDFELFKPGFILLFILIIVFMGLLMQRALRRYIVNG